MSTPQAVTAPNIREAFAARGANIASMGEQAEKLMVALTAARSSAEETAYKAYETSIQTAETAQSEALSTHVAARDEVFTAADAAVAEKADIVRALEEQLAAAKAALSTTTQESAAKKDEANQNFVAAKTEIDSAHEIALETASNVLFENRSAAEKAFREGRAGLQAQIRAARRQDTQIVLATVGAKAEHAVWTVQDTAARNIHGVATVIKSIADNFKAGRTAQDAGVAAPERKTGPIAPRTLTLTVNTAVTALAPEAAPEAPAAAPQTAVPATPPAPPAPPAA